MLSQERQRLLEQSTALKQLFVIDSATCASKLHAMGLQNHSNVNTVLFVWALTSQNETPHKTKHCALVMLAGEAIACQALRGGITGFCLNNHMYPNQKGLRILKYEELQPRLQSHPMHQI